MHRLVSWSEHFNRARAAEINSLRADFDTMRWQIGARSLSGRRSKGGPHSEISRARLTTPAPYALGRAISTPLTPARCASVMMLVFLYGYPQPASAPRGVALRRDVLLRSLVVLLFLLGGPAIGPRRAGSTAETVSSNSALYPGRPALTRRTAPAASSATSARLTRELPVVQRWCS